MACDACAHAESKLCALRSLSQLPAAKRRERRKRRAGRLAQPLTKQKLEGLLKPPPPPQPLTASPCCPALWGGLRSRVARRLAPAEPAALLRGQHLLGAMVQQQQGTFHVHAACCQGMPRALLEGG